MNNTNLLNFNRILTSFKATALAKTEIISIFIGSLALSVLIQFPSFFTYYERDDEATFILMGQSILDGHLPYTELWDIKPPLAFLFFGLAIALFGKTIASVRFAGAICIALSATLTYITGKKIWNFRIGIISAILLTLITALGTSPGELSGSLALSPITIVPLVASLTLISSRKLSPKICFFTGVCIGLAAMIRLNIAYVAIFVGCTILLLSFKQIHRSILFSIKCGLAFSAGCLIIVFATYLPYLIYGYQKLWWDAVISASLGYTGTALSVFGAFGAQLKYLLASLSNVSSFGINLIVWIGGFSGLFLLAFSWRNLSKSQKYSVIFLVVFLVATEISILKGGRAFGHYYIQIYPFLSLLSAFFLEFLLKNFSRYSKFIISLLLLFSVGILPLIAGEYKNLFSRLLSGESLFTGVPLEVADYLKQNHYSGEPMLLLRCNIVYWILGSKPLSKSTTHPANIVTPSLLPYIAGAGATTESELAKILNKHPKYIVCRDGSFTGIAGTMFNATLKQNFNLVKNIHGLKIYKIKDKY